jgi:hypothetical protein
VLQLFVSEPVDLDGDRRAKLQSVMERNDLDDFLTNALMAEQVNSCLRNLQLESSCSDFLVFFEIQMAEL